jgi:uncharacterized membrane protein YqaE (UPF0057 family)
MAGVAAGIVIGNTMRESIDTVVNGVFQGISMAPMMLVVALLVLMRDLVIKILKVLPIMIRMAVSLLDPFSFVKDLLFGIMMGIEKLISGISDIFIGKAQESGEKIPGFKNGLFPNGVFGASKETQKGDTVKCLKPTTIRLILMILCPPFAVFMKYGLLRGWVWIIICWWLTYYCYYFPGLLFSALHTMCF